jgi:hypothetical protein
MHARLGKRRALRERTLTMPELQPLHRLKMGVRIEPGLQLGAALRDQIA